MKINNFKVGDVILITSRNNRGYNTRMAQVFCLNYKGFGLVTFVGKYSSEFQMAGFGAFDPEKLGSSKYGYQTVCILSNETIYWG